MLFDGKHTAVTISFFTKLQQDKRSEGSRKKHLKYHSTDKSVRQRHNPSPILQLKKPNKSINFIYPACPMKCEAYFIGVKYRQISVADLTGINFFSFLPRRSFFRRRRVSLSQSVSVVPRRLRRGVKFSFIDLKL